MRIARLLSSVLGLLLIPAGCQKDTKKEAAGPLPASAAATGAAAVPGGYTLEGPYSHENLAIYVIPGKGGDARDFLTLNEGLAAGTVSVREQGGGEGEDRSTVNTLEIENRSDKWLFVQAGDVIKGGKQDRTIGIDITLAPHSPPQPIQAFCVEHGRWRPGASMLAFDTNSSIVSGNDLKLAIQQSGDQNMVWKEVEMTEARGAVSFNSCNNFSSTGTYNAIIENEKIQEGQDRYVDALLPKLEEGEKIGMVVVINGEVTAADVYGSPVLFRKLAKKLIESYALDALLARDPKGGAAPPPPPEAARAFLADAEKAAGRNEKIASRMHRNTRETEKTILYEYQDAELSAIPAAAPQAQEVLHRAYLKK